MNELNKHTLTQTVIAGSMNELNKHTLTQKIKLEICKYK